MKRVLIPFLVGLLFAAPHAQAEDVDSEQVSEDLSKAFSVFGQSIQAETTKAETAKTEAAQSVAAFKTQQEMQWRANDTAETLNQPDVTCQSVNNSNQTAAAAQAVRQSAGQKTATLAKQFGYNGDPAVAVNANYTKTMQTFCSKADVALGRCDKPADPKLQRGDMRADLMFGDGAGSFTRDPSQNDAADAVVARLTNTSMAPAVLPDPAMEKTIQGRAYVTLQRRYAAIMSMAAYSFTSISANHAPTKSLTGASK